MKRVDLYSPLFTAQEPTAAYDDPIIQLVNNIIQEALKKSASDIHIEPFEKFSRIRYRQDGLLHEVMALQNEMAARLNIRLKVMANLDIAEKRLPQDGRFRLYDNHSANIDVRINTCPTLFGEKIVLRLLDEKKISLQLHELGLTEKQYDLFIQKISQPQGLILVTGPTGSGKTVTLYSALRYLNKVEINIATVEDPVEIELAGINQVSVNPKIGLDFATVLRSFLRQDPDIIMVGEIRDKATAEIAVQAAQTGHLVLSTVHTNSATETLARLEALGVNRYDLSSAVTLIMSQRLLRKLCLECNTKGCGKCWQGFSGRIGIYELWGGEEFVSLREIAMEKIRAGLTTIHEVNRIINKNSR